MDFSIHQRELHARLEFAACRRAPLKSIVRELWPLVEEPELFRRFCESHGVGPSVFQGLVDSLGSLEFDEEYRWRGAQLRNRNWAKKVCSELVRVHEALCAGGVRCLTYKGIALANQVYGDIGCRPPGDIDLLVSPADAEKASLILLELGYLQMMPGPLSQSQEAALRRFSGGRQFYCSSNECRVDLHWAMFSRWVDLDPGFEALWSHRRLCELDRGSVSTLGTVDNLVLLALHGCQHRFQAYKQVLDLSRGLQLTDTVERRLAVERAGHRGPMVGFSFRLAAVLETRVPLEKLKPGLESSTISDSLRLEPLRRPIASSLLDPIALFCTRSEFTTRRRLFRWGGLVRTLLTPSIKDVASVDLGLVGPHLYYLIRLSRLGKKAVIRLSRGLRFERAIRDDYRY